jgi:hypothetical protein
LVERHQSKNWKIIATNFKDRTRIQCLHRWNKILKPGLTKGSWTIEEDKKLLEWVEREGPRKWTLCSKIIQGREGKQCRERWFNSLNPKIKVGAWTVQEDFIIFKRFSEFGSKWTKIASELTGRSENSIKNRFYSTLRSFAKDCKKNSSSEVSSLSLSKLLTFFHLALDEKTKNYLLMNANILENPKTNKTKKKFLTFKRERNEKLDSDLINKNDAVNCNGMYNIDLFVNINNINIEPTKDREENISLSTQTISALDTAKINDEINTKINENENNFDKIDYKNFNESKAEKLENNLDDFSENQVDVIPTYDLKMNENPTNELILKLDNLEKIVQAVRQNLNHTTEYEGKNLTECNQQEIENYNENINDFPNPIIGTDDFSTKFFIANVFNSFSSNENGVSNNSLSMETDNPYYFDLSITH